MSAQGLTDGGAARFGARQSSHGQMWWSCSRPSSGMEMTWSGVWYGQRGDGCGRSTRSPPWMPCKHPPGRRAPWVRSVPTTESWRFGSDTRRAMGAVRSLQVPVPALGPGVFKELPQGGGISNARLGRNGMAAGILTGRVGRFAKWATSQAAARPYACLEELRSFARACDGTAQWTAYGMAVLSFTCAYWGWVRQPLSDVAGSARGV